MEGRYCKVCRRGRRAVAEALEPRRLLSISLVQDINATGASSSPANFVNYNNVLYFSATDGINGTELWRSDGTDAGIYMVKDINPGSAGSSPTQLTLSNGLLFFVANDGSHGSELWKTDGTGAGTAMVADIKPGAGSGVANFGSLIDVNGNLFFGADNGSTGTELWKTDGTTAGTMLLKDIDSGLGSAVSNLTGASFNGLLYFNAYEPAHGAELWTSDGTPNGTTLFDDISLGQSDSAPANFTLLNNQLFFTATTSSNGNELWKTDGTLSGTTLVKDIYSGSTSSSPAALTAFNGNLYFTANDGSGGQSVYKSDGTTNGTIAVGHFSSGGTSFAAFNNFLYFNAVTPTYGNELWRTDGTTSGTQLVKDIYPGSTSSNPAYLTPFAGALFFSANNTELWKTDGTNAGTVLVKSINSSTALGPLIAIGPNLFFAANSAATGRELWGSDGTANGTNQFKDINTQVGNNSSSPASLTVVGNTVYFAATDGLLGTELWKTDSTSAGTSLVKDIYPGANSSNPSNLTAFNGLLFFTANDGSGITKVFRSDGTDAGTFPIFSPAASTSFSLRAINNILFFASGGDLYRTDGTAIGTTLLRSGIFPAVSFMTAAAGTIFFSSSSKLWKTDGTPSGTVQVNGTYLGQALSSPTHMTAFNNLLIFTATTSNVGHELWVSDGTDAGTTLLKDINPGTGSSFGGDNSPTVPFTVFNSAVYFTPAENGSNDDLWKTDGAPAGTIQLTSANTGAISSIPQLKMYGLSNRLYFTASDSAHGRELFSTDGTPGGTAMFADLLPGTASSNPSILGIVNNRLCVLAGTSNGSISNLWSIDGTPADTVTIASPTGTLDGSVYSFNNTLFFDTEFISPVHQPVHFWRSDGTGDNTVELPLGPDPISASGTTASLNNTFLFRATDSKYGNELRKYTPTFVASLGAVYTLTGPLNGQTLSVASGQVTFLEDSNLDEPNLTISAASGTSLVFDAAQHLASLSLDGAVTSLSAGPMVTGSLSITNGASLDLSTNALIVAQDDPATLTAIRSSLISGRAGNWSGPGIQSSYAHQFGNGSNLAIGYADNMDLAAVRAAGSYTSFAGQTVSSNAVLIQMTRGADATLDGVVDAQDVTILGSHFNKPNSGQWCFGDFDYSGTCDATDVTTLGSTFGKTTPSFSAAQQLSTSLSRTTSAAKPLFSAIAIQPVGSSAKQPKGKPHPPQSSNVLD